MLGLFIPWGPDYENLRFRIGQRFSSLWEELKLTLSQRILFHVHNFDALQRSREEALADRRRYQDHSEEQEDCGSDTGEHISENEEDNFTNYEHEEISTVNVIPQDVSSAIEIISSALDSRRGFWTKMEDLKRTTELSSALKMRSGEVVGRGACFERSGEDYATLIKEWTSVLNQQASIARKRKSGVEGDVEDDEAIGEDLSSDSN